MSDANKAEMNENLKTQTGEFLLHIINEYEGQEVPETIGAAVIHAFLTPLSTLTFSCTILRMKKGHGKEDFKKSSENIINQLQRIQSKVPVGLLEHLHIERLKGYLDELKTLIDTELTEDNYESVASSIELVCKDIRSLLQTQELQKYQI